ncbi:helix-turn-helix transcriptional regulator [Sphingomonas sp. PP-CE-1G-424]|uniref:helix-turn-helix domain-containing protein n=1 Tax=Sphingomonas sp. PP-CE-1G-424 TaxID=2135658 RepID=UPI0010553424|nr:helix-turn-helix transcriptional regulator [Sphingomonas sp. PP-CE-1G-424]
MATTFWLADAVDECIYAFYHAFMTRSTPDSVISIETARRRLGRSQSQIATALGITQGHYSKVVKGQAPLSPALEGRMHEWLEANAQPVVLDAGAHRMRELAASIRMQCIELMHLADRVLDASPAGTEG